MSVIGFDMETSSEDLIMEPHRHIIRGKRTKRSQPSVVTSSSSGGYSLENDACFSIVFPQSCENSVSTEEDEAMANCLILLAQSGNSFNSKQHQEEEIHTKKLITTSKFTEMANSTAEKAGFYVYECKTCNRNFPSFQALGGHRASHKRPKTEEKKLPITTILNENNEDQELTQFKKTSISMSPQKAKVHECSICGSEFSSGQALGGHMRRHRIPTTNTSTTINSRIEQEDQKPRNILELDLNLPAPEDHDHYESKFQFVFSAPPLVGCHY